MLPKETKEVLKLRDTYALFNYQIFYEMKRFINQKNDFLSKDLE